MPSKITSRNPPAEDKVEEKLSPSGIMERTLAIIELLSRHAAGLPISSISADLRIPLSATHRLTSDLQILGYIHQEGGSGGRYRLTMKSVSIAFTFLASCGITDLAQPLLDKLATESGELVRLAVPDGNKLTWIARAQGSRSGLKYDPEMGQVAHLSCTATGLAWLAAMPDSVAVNLVKEQGYGAEDEFGPQAPRSDSQLLSALHATRKRGFSLTVATFAPWMTAIGCVIRSRTTNEALATLSIAGPTLRLPEARALDLGERLVDAAEELGNMQIIPREISKKL
ncbi:IclR family transcriptional regulator [Acetobacter tropicalis]|uniref:Regulatory protein, IclR n=2 Tax=Acetobacter tropicalis TaxID=104102 RepID=A0A094ZI97_9PROT|nr:IclR family transcriptional regulator [Acetobacter tropicalis]KGB22221.1 regulatory protein, IclR [Acetobacter tropicalis]MBC9008750.1 IclR family transcriptional regulator [Acetobacter tropicalis]MDO8173141.1 IclR family transcriptional regulator [Acetobacter tropicalis]